MLIPTQLGVMKNRKDIQFFNHFCLILVHFFDFSSFLTGWGIPSTQITKEKIFPWLLKFVFCICPIGIYTLYTESPCTATGTISQATQTQI